MANRPYGVPDSGGVLTNKLLSASKITDGTLHVYFAPGQSPTPDALQANYFPPVGWPVANKLARVPRVVMLATTVSRLPVRADFTAWTALSADLNSQLQAIDANTYCVYNSNGSRNLQRMTPRAADVASGKWLGTDLLVLNVCNCNDGDAASNGYWSDGVIIPHTAGTNFPTTTYKNDKQALLNALPRYSNFAAWFYFDSSQPSGTDSTTYNLLKGFGANLGNEVPDLAAAGIGAEQKANVTFAGASAATFLSDIRSYWGI